MESVVNEMRQYLEVLKEGFNPSSVSDLQALLFLVYFEYNALGQQDPIFIQEIKGLIERVKEAESHNRNDNRPPHDEPPCDCGCPTPFEGPRGPEFGPMGPMGPEFGPRGPMGPEFGPRGPEFGPMGPGFEGPQHPDAHNPVHKFMQFGMRRLFFDDNNRMHPRDIFGFGPEEGRR